MSHPLLIMSHPLPDGLIPFYDAAITALQDNAILHIEFSGPAYHIECALNGSSEWVFIQLKADYSVQDLFCGCQECSQSGYCIHMAIALLGIFNDTSLPLHQRFALSPFYTLCSEHYLENTVHKQSSSVTLGPLKCTGKIEPMLAIIAKNEGQTEENSIKFSNLSDEDLREWNEGRPPSHLSFELSPFTDICKYLFILYERQHAEINFEADLTLPMRVTLHYHDFVCTFALPSNLQNFLDSLLFCKTNLKIEHFGGKHFQGISILNDSFSLALTGVEIDLSNKAALPSSDWYFIENFGFVRKLNESIQHPMTELPFFLDGFLGRPKVHQPQYSFAIDENYALKCTPYLTLPNDLSTASTFGSWLLVEKTNFLRTIPSQIPLSGINIPQENVAEFIENHKNLLSTQPGFYIHKTPLDHCFSYSVDRYGALTFSQVLSKHLQSGTIKYGHFLYIPEKGFYPCQEDSSLFNIPIPPHKVSTYIDLHQEFLKQVPSFFAEQNPVKETLLTIDFKKNQIHGSPTYLWKGPKHEQKAILYGSYGYIENIGFFPLQTSIQDHPLEFVIPTSDKDLWTTFFSEQIPLLQKIVTLQIDPSLSPPKSLQLICQNGKLEDTSFDASFYYQSEKGQITSHELLLLSTKIERFIPTKAGLLDLTQTRFAWLTSMKAKPPNQPYQLKNYDFLKISAFEPIFFDESTSKTAQESLQRLLYALPQTPPELSLLKSALRPYQSDGVYWLWNLYSNNLSGLLCDDMGVGKTHQALGLVAGAYSNCTKKGKKARFLIVCPTSLIWHWKEKVEQLLPSLLVNLYAGIDRSFETLTDDYDVLITTYGIWRNDSSMLSKISFEIAIFDELQIAKNHVSQIWTALTKVSSRMRIGLTGTPIENGLRELKALFDLILPNYFPSEALFKKRPSLIGTTDYKTVIAAYAKPFILRRSKQDVLSELPIKTESLITVDLLPDQKDLYRQVALRETTSILTMLEGHPEIVPYMHIFTLLTTLKHICNHPATYAKDIDHYEAYSSAKWEAFQELLEEAINSGQKVVVFSHSLQMLDIMTLYLHKKGIAFAQIRGSTKDRKEQLERFQQNHKCKVFLASLMAAGLGIDLTAGSVVIHYDRWWNAARENQATDRVHRLGQNRGVMVYKLMTAKTVEERIDRIISGKSSLLEEVLSYDDHRLIKHLSQTELIELLHGIGNV